jgi:uncharacterized membrane protein YcaP (DUF421 family)
MDGFEGFLSRLWSHVGITGTGIVGVALAAVVLYLVFALILRIAGTRLSAAPSTASFALMALLGALCARAILGDAPTLCGALVAIIVLMVMESLLGRLRGGATRIRAMHGADATVVVVHGHLMPTGMRGIGLQESDLVTMLRRAGVHRLADADLVILEPRGGLTVLRPGERIEDRLLVGVRGAEHIPASMREGRTA